MTKEMFRKMIAYTALGLEEKCDKPDSYVYSGRLIHGMNIFSAFAFLQGRMDILNDMNETVFIEKYASKPINEWFKGFDETFISEIRACSEFDTGALLIVRKNNRFSLTDECNDLLSAIDKDTLNIEQNEVYKILKELPSSMYTCIRQFLVENPICSESKIRLFKIDNLKYKTQIAEIFRLAYEKALGNYYICPKCGWTMYFYGRQAYCCNNSCAEGIFSSEGLAMVESVGDLRLKRGVMRYISIPGQFELRIKEKAEKLNLKAELWPDKDSYDIKIILPDGSFWAIDAKTYKNPKLLAKDIEFDYGFHRTDAARVMYVVPDELKKNVPDYCDICNDVLPEGIECCTFRDLFNALRKEINDGSDNGKKGA